MEKGKVSQGDGAFGKNGNTGEPGNSVTDSDASKGKISTSGIRQDTGALGKSKDVTGDITECDDKITETPISFSVQSFDKIKCEKI